MLAAEHRGEAVTRCLFMWVDQGMPLVRGLIQGFPKKPGSIWITKPVTVGRAGPRLAPGGRFGATLAAADRRLAEASVTLRGESTEGPTVNSPPLLNTRYFPSGRRARSRSPSMSGGRRRREMSTIWEGDATLRFFESPADELSLLAPVEVGKGFWFSFGYTVDGGRRVE